MSLRISAHTALLSGLVAYGALGPLTLSEETTIGVGRNNSTSQDGKCVDVANPLLQQQRHAGANNPSREGGRGNNHNKNITEKAGDLFKVPKEHISKIAKALTKRCDCTTGFFASAAAGILQCGLVLLT